MWKLTELDEPHSFMLSLMTINWPNLQILQCTCPVCQNTPIKQKYAHLSSGCVFKIWDRCMVELERLVYLLVSTMILYEKHQTPRAGPIKLWDSCHCLQKFEQRLWYNKWAIGCHIGHSQSINAYSILVRKLNSKTNVCHVFKLLTLQIF